ncbi:MAG: HAMP domain-containing sensor histidine kinase [Anaerolineae bacterium]
MSYREETPPSTVISEKLRFVTLGVAFYLALGGYFYFINPLSQERMVLFSDIYRILASWIAAVASFFAYYTAYRREKALAAQGSSWAWIGLATLSWCVGEVLSLYFEVVRGHTPFPSWADLFFSLFYLFFTIALFVEYRRRDVIPTMRQSYEISFLTVLMTAISGYFIIYPAIANTSISLLESLVGVLYPLGDISLVYSVLNMLISLEQPKRQRAWLLILLGLLAYTVSNSSHTYLALNDRYISGTALDMGWGLGFILVALGAYEHYLWQVTLGPEEIRSEKRPLLSLRIKFTFFTTVLILIVIFILNFIIARQQRQAIGENYRQLIWFSLNTVRAESIQALKKDDPLLLHDVVESQQSYARDILDYIIVKGEGDEVLAYAPPRVDLEGLYGLEPLVLKSKEDLTWPEEMDRESLDVSVFLEDNGSSVKGKVIMRVRLTPWKESLLRLNNTLIAVAFVALILGIISASLLANTLTWPLKMLVEATRRAAEGELEGEVEVESQDEIGFLASSFNQMMDNLRKAQQMREDLTRMIVHDLRNPLITIRTSLNALQEEDSLTKEQKDFLTIAWESSQNLLDMVNTLLDVSRLETKEMGLELEEVSLPEVLEKAIGQLVLLAQDRRIEIEKGWPEDVPKVLADRDKLRRVLVNLLDNAIKFSPVGEKVTLRVEDNMDGKVRISIADKGEGILPEHHKKIFEKFYQVQRTAEGSGLGLAFCKLVVEAHGGQIWVESAPGEGSTFYLTIPVKGGNT